MILDLYPRSVSRKSPGTTESAQWPAQGSALGLSIEILEKLLGATGLPSLSVRFWDGSRWPDDESRRATLVLNRPSALKEMLSGGSEISVAEAYVRGAFEIEGDMIAACDLADALDEHTLGWTKSLVVAALLAKLPNADLKAKRNEFHVAKLNGKKHSPERDGRAVQFHYDVSNEFYALWLDSRMVYSCGYFETADASLEQAQVDKLDYICRKLDLRAGERFLDIGCGWGALLLHAARYYGAQAEGVTLSRRQYEWALKRIREEDLGHLVTVRLCDYRALPSEEGFDKIASVGMVEHVGTDHLSEYFRKAWSLLKPGGLFLNHGIGFGPHPRKNEKECFIQEFVFPDSDLQPIGEMLQAAEHVRFDVRDVESLREHYAKTLRHWLTRLEARQAEAADQVGEEAYRVWRLYLAGSAHGFQRGHLSIYQTLLAKTDAHGTAGVPLTRGQWYGGKGRR